jgi:hypothetical protein
MSNVEFQRVGNGRSLLRAQAPRTHLFGTL